ncbi:MAG: oxidoreductase [Actinomycetota bacterium]
MTAIAGLPGVAEACAAARDEVDGLLWDRGVRARAAEVARESVVRGARDSAALEGAELSIEAMLAGLDDSPLGRAAAAALDVTAEIPHQVDTWQRAPLQVLAHLHVLAARSFADDSDLGRPRTADDVVDPLHIGALPSAAEVSPRLASLADVITTSSAAPAIVLASIVHGELLALRPFAWGSGLIARAGVRLVLASRGVDPDLMSAPEAGMLSLGRRSYVDGVRDYMSGDPSAMARWVMWNAAAVGFGASSARA